MMHIRHLISSLKKAFNDILLFIDRLDNESCKNDITYTYN